MDFINCVTNCCCVVLQKVALLPQSVEVHTYPAQIVATAVVLLKLIVCSVDHDHDHKSLKNGHKKYLNLMLIFQKKGQNCQKIVVQFGNSIAKYRISQNDMSETPKRYL